MAIFRTGAGVKGKKKLYLLTLRFINRLAFILFVMTPGAQTIGNIAVYGSAKQIGYLINGLDGKSSTVLKFCHGRCFFLV